MIYSSKKTGLLCVKMWITHYEKIVFNAENSTIRVPELQSPVQAGDFIVIKEYGKKGASGRICLGHISKTEKIKTQFLTDKQYDDLTKCYKELPFDDWLLKIYFNCFYKDYDVRTFTRNGITYDSNAEKEYDKS